ncbi:MAG: hypothetical protein ACRC8K_15065 [Waterburya sp.]
MPKIVTPKQLQKLSIKILQKRYLEDRFLICSSCSVCSLKRAERRSQLASEYWNAIQSSSFVLSISIEPSAMS